MGQGSIVANSSQSPRRWLPNFELASRRAIISAWAVGSESVILRFQPRPTIKPACTTTAPTGTSPASSARCAARRASSIQNSSETLVGRSSSVVRRRFADTVCTVIVSGSENAGSPGRMEPCRYRRGQLLRFLRIMICLLRYGDSEAAAQSLFVGFTSGPEGHISLSGSQGDLYRAVSFAAAAGSRALSRGATAERESRY